MLRMGRERRPDGKGRPPSEPAYNAPDDSPPDVAFNLKALRRQQGLSLENLARLSGVSRAMLGQIETGKSVPTITLIWKIARALGVEVTDVIARRATVRQILIPRSKVRSITTSGQGFTLRTFVAGEFPVTFEFSEIEIAPEHREEVEPMTVGTRAILLVTSGEVELELEGEPLSRIAEGDAILFRADIAHSYFNPSALRAKGYLVAALQRNGKV